MPEGGMPDMQVLTWTVNCWRLSCRRPLIWKSLKPHQASKGHLPAPVTNCDIEHWSGDSGTRRLKPGEKIRIHIEERRYMGRAD